MDIEDLASRLVQEGGRRHDPKYIKSLYERQKRVNESIIDFVGQSIIPVGARVLDACAGPGGLASAGAIDKWWVVSNDLARQFALEVKEKFKGSVVVSSATDLPYANGSFDAVFYVYAINNILRVGRVISETERILGDGGVMVVSDPGPSVWMSEVLLYWAAGGYEKSIEYFQNKDYSYEDYAAFVAKEFLGVPDDELKAKIHQINARATTTQDKKSVPFRVRELLEELYLNNLFSKARENGFVLEKAGVGVTALGQKTSPSDEQVWLSLANIHPINADLEEYKSIIGRIMDLRKNPGLIPGVSEDMVRSPQRIVYPVLVFRKQIGEHSSAN